MKFLGFVAAGALALCVSVPALAVNEHATGGTRDPQAAQTGPKTGPKAVKQHRKYLAEVRKCKGITKQVCIQNAKQKYGEM